MLGCMLLGQFRGFQEPFGPPLGNICVGKMFLACHRHELGRWSKLCSAQHGFHK